MKTTSKNWRRVESQGGMRFHMDELTPEGERPRQIGTSPVRLPDGKIAFAKVYESQYDIQQRMARAEGAYYEPRKSAYRTHRPKAE